MPNEAISQAPPSRWLSKPRKLFAATFWGIHGVGLRLAGFGLSTGQYFRRGIKWMGWQSLKGLEALFMRHRASRQAMQGIVRESALTTGSIPADGSRMSAGASENIQEILQIIDDSVETGISEGTWARVAAGLEEVTEATPNSKLPEDLKGCDFFRTIPQSIELLRLAAKCSKAAYGNTSPATDEHLSTANAGPSMEASDIATEVTNASIDGMIKACVITSREGGDDQLLVVAIRGTASLVDWLVNLDGDLEPTGDFLSLEGEESTKAHRGLLRVANRMLPTICSNIISRCQMLHNTVGDQKFSPEILFTGHSAGGGVAALICAHIRNHCPEIVQSFHKIHCITFAAPPVLAPLCAASADLQSSGMLTLNIAYNGDIVPRAEKNYIRSLLKLYSERAEHPSRDQWNFGEPSTFNYGQIFILKDTSDDDVARVHAYKVSQNLWQTLAFGSVRAHPMNVYLEAVEDFVALHRS